MAKYKLPLKDIDLEEYKNRRSLTLYQKNKLRLSFLPKIFMSLVVVFFVFSVLIYFNTFGLQDFFRNASSDLARSKSPQELVSDNKTEDDEVNQNTSTSTNLQRIEERIDNLFITNPKGEECELVFSQTTPDTVSSMVSSAQEGWWVVDNCVNRDLKALQVLRVSNGELNIEGAHKFDTISPYTYLVVYADDLAGVNYVWGRYVDAITKPVFTDRVYFDPASSYDTKAVNSNYYYLSKGCRGGSTDSCSLWMIDRKTGQLERLADDLLRQKRNSGGVVSSDISLKFAKTQDYSLGINLITYNKEGLVLELSRFNTEKMEVLQKEDLKSTDKRFALYYR